MSLFPNPNKDLSGVCCSFKGCRGGRCGRGYGTVCYQLGHVGLPYLWRVSWVLVPAWRPPDFNQTVKSLTKTPGGRPPCGPSARAVGRGPSEGKDELGLGLLGNLRQTS